jgi:uncharacterized DUF497 family protein
MLARQVEISQSMEFPSSKACTVFFDPFAVLIDATSGDEPRQAIIGLTSEMDALYIVHLMAQDDVIRIISARPATSHERSDMNLAERMRKRLRKDRPMTTISLRVPEDVIEDLKEIAPTLGFSGYQPLMKAYIGQGLRKDLERLDHSQAQVLTESLRKRGLDDQAIAEVLTEANLRTA